jgi:hypothetical protein
MDDRYWLRVGQIPPLFSTAYQSRGIGLAPVKTDTANSLEGNPVEQPLCCHLDLSGFLHRENNGAGCHDQAGKHD